MDYDQIKKRYDKIATSGKQIEVLNNALPGFTVTKIKRSQVWYMVIGMPPHQVD